MKQITGIISAILILFVLIGCNKADQLDNTRLIGLWQREADALVSSDSYLKDTTFTYPYTEYDVYHEFLDNGVYLEYRISDTYKESYQKGTYTKTNDKVEIEFENGDTKTYYFEIEGDHLWIEFETQNTYSKYYYLKRLH
jgi:uncharacterized lipoprotein NlpE involved in copper resistance